MHPTPEKIDRYQVLRSLGKGGMGEVFLAVDPLCERQVALKQMRQELKSHPILKERFLREARVAAQLTHPSIIPIFSISFDADHTFYTMPYVEGETLKQILKQSVEEQKEGEVKHPIGNSILSLTRIFLAVCEAIAYTHSKGIIHRDLKPDNIIIGKYGEVLLLDWGLADFVGKTEEVTEEEVKDKNYKDLTRPGKVPGTLNYIAPERVRGEPSRETTDIFSLGVILYQLLTLHLPFSRVSVKHFRKTMHLEKWIDPLEIAPYRDIPQHLADIARRCLHYAPEERFQTVDEILIEIKNFLEGKPEWIPSKELQIDRKEDWEFQENILFAKHTAITRSPDVMEWVGLMISRASFSGNIKIETEIEMGASCQGIGFLLGIPPMPERKGFAEGYQIWIGKECRLYHNDVEVMQISDFKPIERTFHLICLEKINNHLFISIDGKQIFHYISHTPLSGTHLGLLSRDADFHMKPLKVSLGSQNVMVNCLAIPDAFLANKHYSKALLEYRQIASSFAGRAEGREALFRAGVTLLDEASTHKKKKERFLLYHLALEEFGKLRATPAAPLEYLGKSLVYKATKEIEEEIKCLELSLRKYPKHPLLRLIREQIAFRLHETASRQRIAAYHFALLALRHLPQIFSREDNQRLISSLKKHLEPLSFLLSTKPDERDLTIQLAFWIIRPITLIEEIENTSSSRLISNAFYALLMMGRTRWVEENLHFLHDTKEKVLIQTALLLFKKGAKAALDSLSKHRPLPMTEEELRCARFLFQKALLDEKEEEILPYFPFFPHTPFLDALHICALLKKKKWKAAFALLETYPPELLSDEYSPLFVPMGCYLAHAEGVDIARSHFSGSIDLPHPPTSMLLSYYLRGKIDEKKGWIKQALAWEKISLFYQLSLYFHCVNKPQKTHFFAKRLKNEIKKLKI